jgi:hypothetical protein
MENARKIRSVGGFITKKKLRTLNMLKRFGMFKKGLLMDKLKRNKLGILLPIGNYRHEIKNSIDIYSKIIGKSSFISNENNFSEVTGNDSEELKDDVCMKKTVGFMFKYFKVRSKKQFIILIRTLIDCWLCLDKKINIVLCSELDMMFEIFTELLIKLIVYHKNPDLYIESCQFKDGKNYVMRIRRCQSFRSNRSLHLNLNGIKFVRELGLGAEEIFKNFNWRLMLKSV